MNSIRVYLTLQIVMTISVGTVLLLFGVEAASLTCLWFIANFMLVKALDIRP